MITTSGYFRIAPSPDITADATGVTLRFEGATSPEFWMEVRIDLASLDQLTALVEAENTLDRYGDPGDDK